MLKRHEIRIVLIAVTFAVALILGISYSTHQAAKAKSSSKSENALYVRDASDPNSITLSEQTSDELETQVLATPTTTDNTVIIALPDDSSRLSQTINGIEIELRVLKRVGEYLQADICYDLPSDADWLPGASASDVVLTIGDQFISIWGYKMIDLQFSAEGKKIRRCDALQFPVQKEQNLSQLTITIHRLATSMPEQPDCNKAQEKLDAQNIVIQCHHEDHSFSYDIVQMPSSLSATQAHDLVYESLINTVEGPWIFQIGNP